MSSTLLELEELLDKKLPFSEVKNLLMTLAGMFLDYEFSTELMTNHFNIITKLSQFIVDKNDLVIPCLDCLINITSHPGLVLKSVESEELSEVESNNEQTCDAENKPNFNKVTQGFSKLTKTIIKVILNSSDSNMKSKSAHLLSNITRETTQVIDLEDSIFLDDLDNIFKLSLSAVENEQISYETAMITLNLSQNSKCQKLIVEHLSKMNDEILDLCLAINENRLKLLIGVIKNLLKYSVFHQNLVEKTDVLTILLHTLVGLNDYEEKISNEFPENLKFFIGSKKDVSTELRLSILEALYLLSGTKYGRESMRTHNVYDILKNISELDLTDEESDNCLDCIGLLIRTEDEIDCDDLLRLQIPKDIQDKFDKEVK